MSPHQHYAAVPQLALEVLVSYRSGLFAFFKSNRLPVNPNTSSTYAYINSDFSLTYADGSGASGDYANDTIEIGGTTISGLQFGIGYNSTSDCAYFTSLSSSTRYVGAAYKSRGCKAVCMLKQSYT